MIVSPSKLIISKQVKSKKYEALCALYFSILIDILLEITMNNQNTTSINPNDSYDAYWQENHGTRSYIDKKIPYADYQPAYQTGHEGYDRYLGKSFDEAEAELKLDYEAILAQKAGTGLAWIKVIDAVRDAWDKAGTT